VLASATVLFLHARATWRTLRTFSDATSGAMADVERSAAAAEQRATALAGGSEHLQAAIGRLERSLAQLAVLRGALDEVRAAVGGARGAVPRK
jgi:ABC-type transporter Mla subunit MlaD